MESVLVANRGEIAVRIMRTLRVLGIKSIAVYSDVDAEAAHVLEADEAVRLGPASPAESYLNVERVIDAARRTGAKGLHPGYGFLSERPVLARACADAGVTFIGPPPDAMEVLGSKTASRELMVEHGVPVAPGKKADTWTRAELEKAATEIGYPVLLKAAAGGGGKGMRTVTEERTLWADYEAASREATSAFGDGTVFVEKLVASPRHIEFQVLGDEHGNVIHLGERECSIQRRHQKIVEETPSVALDPELRERMGEVAVRAARAAGYTNAGTVEFLLDEDGSFYFLEMNARLQVEHPVTEMVTGVDLVRHQIEVAAGERLSIRQEDVRSRGHSIECRIYAEDPAQGFMPSPGKLVAYEEPRGPGIRVDGGVYAGFQVPLEYDPILAKLITYGEDREMARRRMVDALERYVVLGVATPIAYLRDILRHDAFIRGDTRTSFIPRFFPSWSAPGARERDAVIAAALGLAARRAPAAGARAAAGTSVVASPWETLGAWRIGG